jgi:hypothetical protein
MAHVRNSSQRTDGKGVLTWILNHPLRARSSSRYPRCVAMTRRSELGMVMRDVHVSFSSRSRNSTISRPSTRSTLSAALCEIRHQSRSVVSKRFLESHDRHAFREHQSQPRGRGEMPRCIEGRLDPNSFQMPRESFRERLVAVAKFPANKRHRIRQRASRVGRRLRDLDRFGIGRQPLEQFLDISRDLRLVRLRPSRCRTGDQDKQTRRQYAEHLRAVIQDSHHLLHWVSPPTWKDQ